MSRCADDLRSWQRSARWELGRVASVAHRASSTVPPAWPHRIRSRSCRVRVTLAADRQASQCRAVDYGPSQRHGIDGPRRHPASKFHQVPQFRLHARQVGGGRLMAHLALSRTWRSGTNAPYHQAKASIAVNIRASMASSRGSRCHHVLAPADARGIHRPHGTCLSITCERRSPSIDWRCRGTSSS